MTTPDKTIEAVAEATSIKPALRFDLFVQAVTDYAIYILDPDGYVTSWNAGAQRLKGYTAEEIIGRHYATFFPEEDRLAGKPGRALAEARATGRREEEGWRVRKDGTRFWALAVLDAVHDESGQFAGFAKITRDMSERRAAEEKLWQLNLELEERVRVRTAELESAKERLEKLLREQAVLLREIQHRVKNNLQVVSSILHMAVARERDERTRNTLRDAASRVDAMATVHNLVHRSQRAASLDASAFLEELCRNIARSYARPGIQLAVKADRVPLSLEAATPLGLLATELVTNAFKHAFPLGAEGMVEVGLESRDDGRVAFRMADSGKGLPADWAQRSSGLRLAQSLAVQLGGRLEVRHGNGASFELVFRDPGQPA